MRYLPIKKVEAGMVLAQDILDGQGVMLLGRHQILNQEQIENLDKMGYPGLYIDDKFSEEIEIAEVIKPSIHSKSLEIVHHLFIDRMEEEDVSEQEWQIREAVMQVVDSLLENEEVMYNMMSLKNYDDYTYFHSVNVGILSAVIGAHYGMDEYELRILTTAALLHDIGKKFLEIDILNARRALTDEERRIVLQHPKLGYEFLRDNFDFAPEVYLGVLEHHECYNGEGYPMRKSGDEISIYGRIIKLADVYDAMISKRPYRDPMPPNRHFKVRAGKIRSRRFQGHQPVQHGGAGEVLRGVHRLLAGADTVFLFCGMFIKEIIRVGGRTFLFNWPMA